jgi:hypothetical protein
VQAIAAYVGDRLLAFVADHGGVTPLFYFLYKQTLLFVQSVCGAWFLSLFEIVFSCWYKDALMTTGVYE